MNNMAKKEKEFNFKAYGIFMFFSVALILTLTCVFTFSTEYTAFHPDKVAVAYVDTVVQTGDGYNAYKNTLASKNMKYGDFIRKYYINPVVYRDTDYVIGGSTDGLKGYNDDSFMGEKALSDDGTLMGQLVSRMYDYYENLVEEYGWDDYNSIYSNYMQYLITVREEIFGDSYLSDELFFTAFEANVKTYGEKLTGTEDVFDENTGVQLSTASTGYYEQCYGEDYRLTVRRVAEPVEINTEEYLASADKAVYEPYGVSTEDISEVRVFDIDVENQNEEEVTSCRVTVCKIGKSWYVDHTATDTSSLYGFYNS